MPRSDRVALRDIFALNRWVQFQCAKSGLRAVFRDDIPGPCTSKKEILIPEFNDKMTDTDVAKLRGFVLHECLHHIEGPEVFAIGEENRLTIKHPLGALHNMFEDMRIEREGSRRYAGDAQIISDLREILGSESVKFFRELRDKHGPNSITEESAKIQAAFNESMLAQAEWCPGAALHARETIELGHELSDDIAKYVGMLEKAGLRKDINNTDSPHDTFDLAKKIYGLLWDKTPEEVEQEIQAMQQGNGEGEEGEEGEGEGKGKGKKRGEGEAVKGGVDPESGKKKIPFEWYVKSEHGDGSDMTGHGLGLDYTNHHERQVYVPEPFEAMSIIKWDTKKPVKGNLDYWGGKYGNMATSNGFANQVRRYLQVRSQARYIGGQTKGHIHSRALFRAGMPVIGSGEWNKRVFRKKYQSELLDTSVSLLVDLSGSMSGDKIVHATQAAMMLNHVISNTLRVNTEILGFTHYSNTTIGIIKPFGTRVADRDVYDRLDDMTNKMWGNNDADAIAFGYDRLLKQDTKRKVMVVLSDGSPADAYQDSDPYYSLKRIVREIEEAKHIDIIGIGIMDRNVERFYKKHTTIRSADQLETELLKVINNTILATE